MTRPRAADDFATIRARLKELSGERAPGASAQPDWRKDVPPPGNAESRFKERREGAPPPWVPTIFLS